MELPQNANRRTVLRGISAGVGGMALTGTATAADPPKRGQHHSYAWANGVEWDMLEAEPPDGGDGEGNDAAHRPLWIIAETGLCNSPHPAPEPGIDHVIPLGPGGIYTAQWHVHRVTDGSRTLVNAADGTATTGGDCDDYLLSADDIEAADGNGKVEVVETDIVFTCPARPGSCTECPD